MNIIMHIMPTVQIVHRAKLIMDHLHKISPDTLRPHSREVGIIICKQCVWGMGVG